MDGKESGQAAKPTPRRGPGVRAIMLLILVSAVAAFCLLNRGLVPIHPFGSAPLYLVLVGTLVVGVIIGWVLRSSISRRVRARSDVQTG